MFRKLVALTMIAGFCCTVALAQEQEKKVGPSISEWLKGLQQKIAQIVPKKSAPQSTIVAGVRGAKENSATKLYWKGKNGDEPVTEEEMLEFKKGIDFAAAGKRAESIKILQEFMNQYPDSALIPDAKKTIDLVKAEEK
jgi:TolA-binding protein